MRALLLILPLVFLATEADAKCKRAPNSPICEKGADPADCEELCITTSDSGKDQYKDGRNDPPVGGKRPIADQMRARQMQHEFFERRRAAQEAQQRQRIVEYHQQRAAEYRTQKRIEYLSRFREQREAAQYGGYGRRPYYGGGDYQSRY